VTDTRAPAASGAGDRSRRILALGLYAVFGTLCASIIAQEGHPEAWLALLALPLALVDRRRGLLIGVAFVLGGAWLRVVAGSLDVLSADQLAVSQAAVDVVLEGGNPYGIGYAESVPPGAPFVYGPLMLLWGLTGTWGEVLASIGTLALVAWTRSWVTLAALATFPLFVLITPVGINDSTPGFFITASLLALRTRPVLGGVLLGLAIGLKPYALAWLPGIIGYGGLRATVAAVATSTLAWLPVLWWGPQSFLRSIDLAREVHADSPGGALNIPALRVLAAPVALAALFVRRWTFAVVSGSAIFLIVLFFDAWASFGYWLAVLPITGIALETAASRWRAERAGTPQVATSVAADTDSR
jgi:hypothetical protein